ncbi:MAG: hypothetical protein IT223_10240 [Crocinitomicaceae bacterium]|nr:hypothetical protein [Crocinitomicaceae bacterium]
MKPIAYLILVFLCAVLQMQPSKACSDTERIGDIGSSEQQDSHPPAGEQDKNLEGTVEVAFKIDGGGKVEILNINATNPQLADYVIKKLNKIQLERGDPQIGQIIKYRFVFKKQV